MELNLLARLVLAHVLGDFFLQPKKWVKHKKTEKWHSKYHYLHAFIHAILAYLLVMQWENFLIPLFVFTTHLMIDIAKSYSKGSAVSFIFDQLLHLISLFIIAFISVNSVQNLPYYLSEFADNNTYWLVVSGYLIMTRPIGFLVQLFTDKWQDELVMKEKETGLKDAGKWIGYLERILIFTFLLLDQFEAIGFLITAKSVFRFGDLTKYKERKLTEYVLIGTLLSFTLAILTGILILMLQQG